MKPRFEAENAISKHCALDKGSFLQTVGILFIQMQILFLCLWSHSWKVQEKMKKRKQNTSQSMQTQLSLIVMFAYIQHSKMFFICLENIYDRRNRTTHSNSAHD